MPSYQYTDIKVEFNRPQSLNSFGGNLLVDTLHAVKELDEDPETVFTVLTGEGRFFSAGADVRGSRPLDEGMAELTPIQLKLLHLARFTTMMELMKSLIDHKKVFVLALNGPGVGGGAAWFQGIADIILASETTYLQVPFSSLALVPEAGSATNLARHMGVHRANDFLMFGRKLTVHELESWGLVNRIFPVKGFLNSVIDFLEKQLDVNDGISMMEAKRLQNMPLRSERILAVYNATDALADRLASGAPAARFRVKKAELEDTMPRNESKIEIAAPPAKVREVLLNFPAYPEWHTDFIKGIKIQDESKKPESLVPGDKLECNIEGWKFVAEIRENSESMFSWQGPPVLTIAGLHQFRIEPTKDGAATIFTQSEDLKGPLSFLMGPSLLGKKMAAHFAEFNRDLKARAEAA
ncbi:Enoyl-CoA delta isomerase 3, peroxisomal [Penicillium rolfsii]|nr:Enoyl-CoA delta isomerase 3, peroxisomal [Penicillium rolfsii]